MAENTKKIYPEIQFFGVSCDTYEELCDQYDVQGYPTLRFFRENDVGPATTGIEKEFDAEEAQDENTPREIAHLLNVNSIAVTNVGKHLTNEEFKYKKEGSNGAKSKNLNDGNSNDKNKERFESAIKYSQLYKAEKEKYRQNLDGFGKHFREGGTKDSEGRPVEYASYDEMTKGMKQNTPGTTEFRDRQEAFQKRIEKNRKKQKLQGATQDLEKGNLPYMKDVAQRKWFEMTKMSEEEELILDSTLSLTVALESGLSMGITDITSKSAMKAWLNLLSVSLPPEWNIHKLIHHLKNDFEYATQSKQNFKEVLQHYPLARKGWSASCQNEVLKSEGFSCGFWKLLHVITLGIVEQRGGQNLIDSGMVAPTTIVFSPALAADTIRNYIDEFFTCKPCREHFLATYDDCNNNQRCERLSSDKKIENPSDWKELSLWLWEFHNDVSVRLVRERITSTYTKGVQNTPTAKDEIAVIFPTIKNCIMCFQTNGMWNKAEVFQFLERTYWPDSGKDPLTDKLLTFDSEQGSSGVDFLLWLPMFLVVVWLVYKLTRMQSYSIHQSLIATRLMSKSRTV